MLNLYAIESSLALTEKLSGSNYNITPVLGSPLQRLNTASAIDILHSSDFEHNLRITGEITNTRDPITGRCSHCDVMKDITSFISEKLASQVSYARNYAAGVIEDMADSVVNHLATLPPFEEVGAEIIVRDIPQAFLNPSLMEEVQASHNAARHDVALTMRMAPMSASDIRSKMLTGLPSLDAVVREYIAPIGDNGLVAIWRDLFEEKPSSQARVSKPLTLSQFIRGEVNLRTALIVFLLARNLSQRIPSQTNMGDGEYMRTMADYRVQSAAAICDTLDYFSTQEKNRQMILSVVGLKVTVDSVLYKQFLQSGGSSTAVFGSVLFNEHTRPIESLIQDISRYEKRWEQQYALNSSAYQNRRFQRFKEILLLEYINATNGASEEDFPKMERAGALTAFKKELSELDISSMSDVVITCLRLLGKSRYRHRNVYEVLSGVSNTRALNPKIEAREAFSIAIIEYLSRWIVSQMRIIKNGVEISK